MNELARLQEWYLSNCNGDWEHSWGIKIETLDNPGWSLAIDLTDTTLAETEFERINIETSERDWLTCWIEDRTFHAAGGPVYLQEMLRTFLDWATSHQRTA